MRVMLAFGMETVRGCSRRIQNPSFDNAYDSRFQDILMRGVEGGDKVLHLSCVPGVKEV